MMNSLESNLSLELFGRNGGTLVSTALLCWMRSAQSVYLERDREEEEKWRVPQSPSLAELRSPLTFVTSFDIYTSVVGLPLPSPVHTPGSGTRANHNTVPWMELKLCWPLSPNTLPLQGYLSTILVEFIFFFFQYKCSFMNDGAAL